MKTRNIVICLVLGRVSFKVKIKFLSKFKSISVKDFSIKKCF